MLASMNWQLFAGFLAVTVVLLLTPGPIVTLVISTGATHGVRAGLVTVAGTSLGNAALLAAITLGLSWVLSHALYLFELLRWAGAGYLVWLGVRAWRRAGPVQPVPTALTCTSGGGSWSHSPIPRPSPSSPRSCRSSWTQDFRPRTSWC